MITTSKSRAKRVKAQAKPAEQWTKGDGWQQSGGLIYASGPTGGMICEISEPRASTLVQHRSVEIGSADWNEAMANGTLIASAPELYGVLKDLLDILTKSDTPAPTPFAKLEAFAIGISALINLGEVIERAEKILQQARGEQLAEVKS
jgi:hypothetical protein